MNKIMVVCKHCGSTFTLMSEKSHTNASVCDDCKTVIQREHRKEARAKKRRIKAGKVTSWKSGDEMYNWWIANRKEKEVLGQRSFQFGLYNGEEYM